MALRRCRCRLSGLPVPLIVRLVCPARSLPGLASSRPGLLLSVLMRVTVRCGGSCRLTSSVVRVRLLMVVRSGLPPSVLLPATACWLLSPVVPMSAPACVLIGAAGGVGILLGFLRLDK